jgi:hypothetical protein
MQTAHYSKRFYFLLYMFLLPTQQQPEDLKIPDYALKERLGRQD